MGTILVVMIKLLSEKTRCPGFETAQMGGQGIELLLT